MIDIIDAQPVQRRIQRTAEVLCPCPARMRVASAGHLGGQGALPGIEAERGGHYHLISRPVCLMVSIQHSADAFTNL
ncbi:hypothetical protein [Pseudotabrizicola sp. 4114]|uniref:hypothetical protein n=1 Tax=Pseudotabrizicola sp. 4114 TaxID=2817731 RepID=UPI00285730DA|nr:hypothetical protein [Pseudorhodobacter sp. 4114]